MLKYPKVYGALALLAFVAACTSNQNVTSPSSSVVSTPGATTGFATQGEGIGALKITMTLPQPLAPADAAPIKFAAQPISLTIKNAVSTGSSPLLYGVQVATDANFTGIVYDNKDAAPQGSGGQTSVTLGKLAGAKTYYWRVRAVGSGTIGRYAATRSFVIGPEVVFQQPALGDPANDGTAGQTPTLAVAKVDRTGPVGTVSYRFEVAESSAFASLVYVATVQEQAGQAFTTHTVTKTLDTDKTYFWRVQASDPANAVTSAYSATRQFKVQQFINIKDVQFVCGSPDVSNWTADSRVTSVAFGGGYFHFDYDANGRWPSVAFGDVQQEATVWALFKINGQWYAGGGERIRPLQTDKELGSANDIGFGWYFMPTCGPMQYYTPQYGELVGFMATQGDARIGDNHTNKERTNIVLIKWPGDSAADYPPFVWEEPLSNGAAAKGRTK